MIPGRTTVTVPEGHEVHVNAPGGMAPPPQTGMVADPMAQSALAAMNTTLAGMARPRSEAPARTEPKQKPAAKPAKKKSKKKAKPAAEESDNDD